MNAEHMQWLIGEGRQLLDVDTPASSRRLEPWQHSLLQAQRALRHRSRDRFPHPELWLWTDRSLQQASDWSSAVFKAGLFPSGIQVIDACCGAGADLVAIAGEHPVIGVDRDPAMIELAQANAATHRVQATWLNGPINDIQLPLASSYLHIDPDRRPEGRSDSSSSQLRASRTIHGEAFSPSLSQCIELGEQALGCIIKVAPASQVELQPGWSRCWLGSGKSCPQQLLVRGALTTNFDPSQRAVVLVTAPDSIYFGTETNHCPVAVAADDYLYDLHAALHASGLSASWASDHHLTALEHPGNYFTAPERIESPWVQSFRVLDQMSWDDRRVRKWLRSVDAGMVEVKTRHVSMNANQLQQQLSRPDHSAGQPITCLLYRSGKSTRIIMAQR